MSYEKFECSETRQVGGPPAAAQRLVNFGMDPIIDVVYLSLFRSHH